MKKLLIMLLALVLCLGMVACGDKKDDKDDSSAESSVASGDASTESSEGDNASESEPEASTDASESEPEADLPNESQPDTDAPADVSAIVGKYMIYHMSYNGMELDYDLIAAAGKQNSYLEIKEDGTFTIQLEGGDTYNGTVDPVAQTLILNGDAQPYTMEGDSISISLDTLSISFTKGEIPNAGKPEEGTDSDGKLDVGKYAIYAIEANGVYIDDPALLEAAGAGDAYFEFKADGTVYMSLDDIASSGTIDQVNKTVTFDKTATYKLVGENTIEIALPNGTFITFKL